MIAGGLSAQGHDVRDADPRFAKRLDDVVEEIRNVSVEHAAATVRSHADVPLARREETGLPRFQALTATAARDRGIALSLKNRVAPEVETAVYEMAV